LQGDSALPTRPPKRSQTYRGSECVVGFTRQDEAAVAHLTEVARGEGIER
jgi:hypothetical protein